MKKNPKAYEYMAILFGVVAIWKSSPLALYMMAMKKSRE